MKRRQLLRSGKTVSEIGLGCLSFAGFYGPSTEDEAFATLARATALGIDFLDTANIYGLGLSETLIGRFLHKSSATFTIATKAGIWRDPDNGRRGFNNKPAYLRRELEGSLSRLGVEQVDLFYIHRRDPDIEIEEVMHTLLALKAEGKTAGIGFSEIAPASLRRAAAVGPVDAVQSEYSLWTRQPELGLIQTCKDLGVAMIPYAPLGRGIFAARTPDPERFAPQDFRRANPRFLEPNYTLNRHRLDAFKAYAAEFGIPPSTLAIAWCLARGDHLLPIPGTRSPDHLTECAAASAFEMTAGTIAELEQLLPVGWAHGDRYSQAQWNGPEGYC